MRRNTATQLFFIAIFMPALIGTCTKLSAQDIRLVGTNICSDGYSNSTVISLSDTYPDKIYALFRDGQRLSARQYNPGTRPSPLDLGAYSEPGVYTVVEFEPAEFNRSNNQNNGRQIPGKVIISREPEIYIREKDKEQEIISGSLFEYTPTANMENVEFMWTAAIIQGKLKHLEKEGKNNIVFTPELSGSKKAEVIFVITPIAPIHEGGCAGKSIELKIKVKDRNFAY